jgi:deoxyribodipyrimidine photo-lyase
LLTLRRGPATQVIPHLVRTTGATAVYFNHAGHPAGEAIENALSDFLHAEGVAVRACAADLLYAPASLRTKDGGAPRVFTPFWRRALASGDPARPLPSPPVITAAPALPGDRLEDWALEPQAPDWADGLRATWTAGEAAAQHRLRDFLADGLAGYATNRDRPDQAATSRLSPHLRFGEISPRQVFHATRFAAHAQPKLAHDAEKFISELGWREFSRHLLAGNPDLSTRNLQASFNRFPWRRNAAALRAWQRGRTGYPIVDAGMRELWRTGTMHNRVRMVVASFLVKHLLIDWRAGEKWFWDTLVDADPASNPASWQWVAGCGADAAPYFRIFNPVLQGAKFDPDGVYVRRWVPEIARLPNALLHQPWTATPLELREAGIMPGKTYPAPVVDHRTARERALAALAATKA